MKRHPSLHALSEHHHHALVQAFLIARAAKEPLGRRRMLFRRAAREFLRFWQRTGRQHFREEEEVLLPALARHVALDTQPAVLQMLAQHADIRGRIEELVAAAVLGRNLEPTLTRLGRLLHDHVRLEENQVFPRIEAVLSEKEMRRLGERLTRLHGAPSRRTPDRKRARKGRTTTAGKR